MSMKHIPLDVIRRANDRNRRLEHVLRDTTQPQRLRLPGEPGDYPFAAEPAPSPVIGMIVAATCGLGVGILLTAALL